MLKKCLFGLCLMVGLTASARESRYLILSEDGHILSCRLDKGIFTDCYPQSGEIEYLVKKEKTKQNGKRKT